MAAHRYWRLYLIATVSAPYTMAEAQFRTTPGTPLLFSGGTISTSSDYNSTTNPSSNVADNNAATWWGASTGNNGEWWEYDYGASSTLDIKEVTVTARNDTFYNQTPSSFKLQFSDNNTTWSDASAGWVPTWTSQGQTQTFEVAPTTARLTQIAVEQWASVAFAAAGSGPQAMAMILA